MADEPIGDRARRAQQRAQAWIERLAAAAFDRMWRRLMDNPGMSPRQAILEAQVEFGGGVAQSLAAAFSILLDRSVGTAQVRALPVGEITLAQRLYRHAQAVASEVTAIVREHAKGATQARELALRLYEGYDFDDGIRRPLEGAVRAELPKALRKLTEDPRARRELTALMTRGQQQAARLRSAALRAAYLETFERWEQGGGQEALKRRLWVAQHEKNRYVAERIARTELHRAHQAEVAREFIKDDELEVVQVLLNPRHPVPDICDLHARADLFGLGRGCYPKAKAPRPPYHPFCLCTLRSRPDLDLADARPQPMAAQAFIRSLPADVAARVVGSKARLHQVLAGADPVAVWDAGVKEPYRTQRLGDAAAALGPVVVGAAGDAYRAAKAGGRHAGMLRRYQGETDYAVRKGIASLERRIREHEAKIADPSAHVQPGAQAEQVRYLTETKWPKEIAGFRQEIEVLGGILKERENG